MFASTSSDNEQQPSILILWSPRARSPIRSFCFVFKHFLDFLFHLYSILRFTNSEVDAIACLCMCVFRFYFIHSFGPSLSPWVFFSAHRNNMLSMQVTCSSCRALLARLRLQFDQISTKKIQHFWWKYISSSVATLVFGNTSIIHAFKGERQNCVCSFSSVPTKNQKTWHTVTRARITILRNEYLFYRLSCAHNVWITMHLSCFSFARFACALLFLEASARECSMGCFFSSSLFCFPFISC